jgi:hypothetical protein
MGAILGDSLRLGLVESFFVWLINICAYICTPYFVWTTAGAAFLAFGLAYREYRKEGSKR